MSLEQKGQTGQVWHKIKEASQWIPGKLLQRFDYAPVAPAPHGPLSTQYPSAPLQQVLRLEPDMPAAHINWAAIILGSGQYVEAGSSFRRDARKYSPRTAAVHNGWRCFGNSGADTGGAAAEIKRPEKLEPKTPLPEDPRMLGAPFLPTVFWYLEHDPKSPRERLQ